MRDTLFRGKRIDNGEWIYGFAVVYGIYAYILVPTSYEGDGIGIESYPVDFATISQYTGTNNKNGAKIFEHDIIRANHDGAVGVIRFDVCPDLSYAEHTCHVGYYVDWQGEEKDFLRGDLGYWSARSDVEVIGNIHDNPELLDTQRI